MDNALRMSGLQRISDLDAQIEHRLDLQRLASDPVAQSLSLQQFHGDEGSPLELVGLVNGADVGMVEGGSSLGLPLEAAEGLRIGGEFVGRELQRDVATELEVFRLIDHTHPTAELTQNAVMGHGLPHGLGRRGHGPRMLATTDLQSNVLEGRRSDRVPLRACVGSYETFFTRCVRERWFSFISS